jgi:phosphatidylserine/phosphatidylglycerophosphate/cardiolipin synthase-like enzyme
MYTLIHDESYQYEARKLIDAAHAEILISTFKIQRPTRRQGAILTALLDTLCAKSKAGIRVRLLMNWSDKFKGVAKTNAVVASMMRAAGVDVRYFADGRCAHAKMLIVDKYAAMIGSHNWSVMSFTRNFEVSVLTCDDVLVRRALELYEGAFERAKKWL